MSHRQTLKITRSRIYSTKNELNELKKCIDELDFLNEMFPRNRNPVQKIAHDRIYSTKNRIWKYVISSRHVSVNYTKQSKIYWKTVFMYKNQNNNECIKTCSALKYMCLVKREIERGYLGISRSTLTCFGI